MDVQTITDIYTSIFTAARVHGTQGPAWGCRLPHSVNRTFSVLISIHSRLISYQYGRSTKATEHHVSDFLSWATLRWIHRRACTTLSVCLTFIRGRLITQLSLTLCTDSNDGTPTNFYSTPDLRHMYAFPQTMRNNILMIYIYIGSPMFRVTLHHILRLLHLCARKLRHILRPSLCIAPLKPLKRAFGLVME